MAYFIVGKDTKGNPMAVRLVDSNTKLDDGVTPIYDMSMNANGLTISGITVAAGADVTEGNTTDAAITTNTTGTLSGKLRGIVALLAGYVDLTANIAQSILKPVTGSAYSPTTFKDNGTATTFSVKAAAGNVYSLRVTNANAAVRYVQIHNKASAPSGGETAQQYWLIPAGTATQPGILELDTTFLAPSEYCATGIGLAISTTATTYTAATNGDHTSTVRYA